MFSIVCIVEEAQTWIHCTYIHCKVQLRMVLPNTVNYLFHFPSLRMSSYQIASAWKILNIDINLSLIRISCTCEYHIFFSCFYIHVVGFQLNTKQIMKKSFIDNSLFWLQGKMRLWVLWLIVEIKWPLWRI